MTSQEVRGWYGRNDITVHGQAPTTRREVSRSRPQSIGGIFSAKRLRRSAPGGRVDDANRVNLFLLELVVTLESVDNIGDLRDLLILKYDFDLFLPNGEPLGLNIDEVAQADVAYFLSKR